MKICFVSLDYPSADGGGGVGNQVRILSRALVNAGHQVTVIALAENRQAHHLDDSGVSVHFIPHTNVHWYVHRALGGVSFLQLVLRELEYGRSAYRVVKKLHARESFDLIEGTETGALGLSSLDKNVPVIIRLHGEQYTFRKHTPTLPLTAAVRLERFVQRFGIRHARLLISPSLAHAREISSELRSSHPPFVIIPNCIETPQISERSRAQGQGHMVLYVGRIEKTKGIPELLHAAARVLRQYPEVRFVLAGGFHPTLSQDEITDLKRRLGLDAKVEILGHVKWEALAEWYASATVGVLPSYYETFGIAALESMAYGIPVVATHAGSLPEVVEDGKTGVLVPPGDVERLSEGILRLLADPSLSAQIGIAARERAKQFDVSRILPLNLEAYAWAVERAPTADDAHHLFFSPHSDDVVLSCGGLVHSLVSQGRKVNIITVFGGAPANANYSAFARHLHAKWNLGSRGPEQRLDEDREALDRLGIKTGEHWRFDEAPYRTDDRGAPLYASYSELNGNVAPQDAPLYQLVHDRVEKRLRQIPVPTRLYFPLGLGNHVDHQLLERVGLELRARGLSVRFYGEWPYVESYADRAFAPGWLPLDVRISLQPKYKAVREYVSQIRGLGGSRAKLEQRLKRYYLGRRRWRLIERYWEILPCMARKIVAETSVPPAPFIGREPVPTLRGVTRFLDSLRWHDLEEILPVGSGPCLDLGCGSGRHERIITMRGYEWIGFDKQMDKRGQLNIIGNVLNLPFRTASVSAVVVWQVLEYLEQPEVVFEEACRVLERGGVFCGSVSFLEPVHGKTFYNLSPIALRSLLEKHDFSDVEIQPGLSGFALITWTWFRRIGGERLGNLALPLTTIWLAPLAILYYTLSWLGWRLGWGTGYGMRWLTQAAPLEFAGHVMFVARKAARNPQCTSAL